MARGVNNQRILFVLLGLASFALGVATLQAQFDEEAIAAGNEIVLTANGDLATAGGIDFNGKTGTIAASDQTITWNYSDTADYLHILDSTTDPGFRLQLFMSSSDSGKFVYTGSFGSQTNLDINNFSVYSNFDSSTGYLSATKAQDSNTAVLSVDTAASCASSDSVDKYEFHPNFYSATADYGLVMSSTAQNYLTSSVTCTAEANVDIRRMVLNVPAGSYPGTYASTLMIVLVDGETEMMMMMGMGGAPEGLGGTAATGAPIAGEVTVIDTAGNEVVTTTDPATGFYDLEFAQPSPPYMVRVVQDRTGNEYYSCSSEYPGVANVTPLTTLTLDVVGGRKDAATLFDTHDFAKACAVAEEQGMTLVRSNFASLFKKYNLDEKDYDYFKEMFAADSTGFDAVLDDLGKRSYIDNATGKRRFFVDEDKDLNGFRDDDADGDGFIDSDKDEDGFDDADLNKDGFVDADDEAFEAELDKKEQKELEKDEKKTEKESEKAEKAAEKEEAEEIKLSMKALYGSPRSRKSEEDKQEFVEEIEEIEESVPEDLPATVDTVTAAVETATELTETVTESVATVTESTETSTESVDTATAVVETATESTETVTNESVETATESTETVTESVGTATDSMETVTESTETATESTETATEPDVLGVFYDPYTVGDFLGDVYALLRAFRFFVTLF